MVRINGEITRIVRDPDVGEDHREIEIEVLHLSIVVVRGRRDGNVIIETLVLVEGNHQIEGDLDPFPLPEVGVG